MKTMIYHQAYPFNPESVSASSVRPIRMHQAFKEAGYEVITIAGYARERRHAIRELKKRLKNGLEVDFMYSESSTIPVMLTEKRHIPPHFLLDRSLFALCQRFSIPVGVFYRDIYWVFDEYVSRVGKPLAALMRTVYRYELRMYARFCSRIFVPSLAMMKYLPKVPSELVAQLPPGGEIRGEMSEIAPLHLLYVGGIDAHYDLRVLVDAIKMMPSVRLTLCVAPERWARVRESYDISQYSNIRVVHRKSYELDALYEEANLALIMVDPTGYWEFAMPVKTFEYVAAGKPILASEGTYIADYVEDANLGWKIPYERDSIMRFLSDLELCPELLRVKTQQVISLRHGHSWLARAQQVAAVLACVGRE